MESNPGQRLGRCLRTSSHNNQHLLSEPFRALLGGRQVAFQDLMEKRSVGACIICRFPRLVILAIGDGLNQACASLLEAEEQSHPCVDPRNPTLRKTFHNRMQPGERLEKYSGLGDSTKRFAPLWHEVGGIKVMEILTRNVLRDNIGREAGVRMLNDHWPPCILELVESLGEFIGQSLDPRFMPPNPSQRKEWIHARP